MVDESLKKFVALVIERDDCRIHMMRSAIPGEPHTDKEGHHWETFKAGKTLYLVMALGPVEEHVEHAIRAALGHKGLQNEANRNG